MLSIFVAFILILLGIRIPNYRLLFAFFLLTNEIDPKQRIWSKTTNRTVQQRSSNVTDLPHTNMKTVKWWSHSCEKFIFDLNRCDLIFLKYLLSCLFLFIYFPWIFLKRFNITFRLNSEYLQKKNRKNSRRFK